MNAGCVQARDLASHINRFQNDIHRCVGMIQDPAKLKESITQIYFTHVQDNFVRLRYMIHADCPVFFLAINLPVLEFSELSFILSFTLTVQPCR